jgi:hypothetical protein
MSNRWMRALGLLALAPVAALAFETVDQMPYPSLGAFPEAYGPGPVYPTRVWAQAGMMYDSNPFRLNDAVDPQAALGHSGKEDAIARLGAGLGYTQRVFGRQSVNFEVAGHYYDYLRFHQLDHFAYDLLAEWLWELGNDFNGTVGYGRDRGLADPGEAQQVIRDMVTTDRAFANANYRVGPNLRLRGAVDAGRGKREGDRPDATTDSHTWRVGADYVTPLGNSLGAEYRETRGSAPVSPLADPTGQFTDNEYEDREIAAVATYRAGEQLRFLGRYGTTQRRYTTLPVDEFEGPTWRVRADWLPTAKTGLRLDTYRDVQTILEIDATHVVVRGVAFGPRWAPREKLVFYAMFVNEEREYQSTSDATLFQREETVRIWRLGGGWEPQRHIRIGAGVDWGERTTNVLGRDYDYLQVMINARYDW